MFTSLILSPAPTFGWITVLISLEVLPLLAHSLLRHLIGPSRLREQNNSQIASWVAHVHWKPAVKPQGITPTFPQLTCQRPGPEDCRRIDSGVHKGGSSEKVQPTLEHQSLSQQVGYQMREPHCHWEDHLSPPNC